MNGVLLSTPRHLAASALAIVLGVAFVTATLLATSSLNASIQRAVAGSIRDAAIVVSAQQHHGSTDSPLTDATVAAVRALPGVTGVRATTEGFATLDLGRRHTGVLALSIPDAGVDIVAGRLPSAPGEVAVNDALATAHAVGVGDTLAVEGPAAPREATIVGVVVVGPETTNVPRLPMLFAGPDDLAAHIGWSGHSFLYVSGAPDPRALADVLSASTAPPGQPVTVRTAAEETTVRLDDYTRGTRQLEGMLLAFGGVALMVSALVIANTFTILTAQRTRQLALLRTVGATRAQVLRLTLAEAAVLGVVASGIGIAVGVGLAALGVRIAASATPFGLTAFAVTVRDVVVPLAAGVVVTVLAALVPARAATRVPPLAALRPQAPAAAASARRGVSVVGLVLVVGGLALLGAGVALGFAQSDAGPALLVGMSGGLASLVGFLALGRVIFPALGRALGRALVRLGGVPGELAAENSVRNPVRAAATAGALLVGVTLVTMMTVGAAAGQASIVRQLDRQYPVDAEYTGVDTSLTDTQVQIIATHDLVAAATTRWWVDAELTADDRSVASGVVGVEPDAGAVLRAPGILAGLDDTTVLLAPTAGVVDGSTVRLAHGDRSLTLTARIVPDLTPVVVTAANALRLDPDARRAVGVRLVEGADPVAAPERIADAASALAPVQVVTSAAGRADIGGMIDAILVVVLALLGVAVAIALVGIGNTLGLSVLERRQESGLLRALGLTRAQLRASIGWEAVLLALVAVVVGIMLGTLYGFAGVAVLLAASAELAWEWPALRVAAIAAVALLAGWAASVLPAQRASRVPPAAALALGE